MSIISYKPTLEALTDGNISGSGTVLDPIILKNQINLNAVTSSYLLNGEDVKTSGIFSHAEGINTLASGNYSHAEGGASKAYGPGSHAEGEATKTYGTCAHSEGEDSIAFGNSSHSEGRTTLASGTYSHAEGTFTKATGYGSHAEGDVTEAIGINSHSEGFNTIASGAWSHAEGKNTLASGSSSHTEGYQTTSSADYQHVEGQWNQINETAIHLIGNGSDEYSRSNIFEVYREKVVVLGSQEITNTLTASQGISTDILVSSDDLTIYAENDLNLDTGLNGNINIGRGLYPTYEINIGRNDEGTLTFSGDLTDIHGVSKIRILSDSTSSIDAPTIKIGDGTNNQSKIIELNGQVSASVGVSASYFYGDGSNLTNLPQQTITIPDVSDSFALYVATTGSDTTGNGSLSKPYASIQAAINYASSSINHTASVIIKVAPGVYSGINVTRRNTYFVSQTDNHRQRATWISGPTRIQVSGTQKYNEVCGFDGFLFNTGSGTEPLVHVQGTGSTGLYIQNCQFYSNTTDSNCNLLRVDGAYDQEKVVLKDCVFNGNQTGADLVKITGGDIEFDSCRFLVSGSGASCAISASGDVGIITDRALIENVSSSPAIKFTSPRTFALSNSSITKGGIGRAIESVAPTLLLNSYFNATGSLANYATNLNISGSGIYYSHLTSLVPIPAFKISVTTGTPLDELHGNIYATNISASSITGSISIPNVAYTNVQNTFTTNQIITGSLSLTNNVSASNITSSGAYVNYIDFNTTAYPAPPPPPAQLGRIFYNGSNGDLSTYLDTNGLMLNNGQQLVQKCQNKSGSPISKGTVVHLSGSDGPYDTPHINVADWSNDNNSANTLGLAMQDIAIDATGYVITQGLLTGLSLTGMPLTPANGQVLYLSSSGQITNVKPTAPKHTVSIGQLIAKADLANNKFVYVSIQNGYELEELHDVSASVGKLNGDLLAWDNTNAVWKNTKELSGSYSISGSLTLGDIFKAPQKTKLSSDPGETGQICWDDNNIFVYTSTGWKSSSLN